MTGRERKLALILAGLLLFGGFVVVEVVLRVYANAADTSLALALRNDPYAVLVEPHGEMGYRPRAGSVFSYDTGADAVVNEQGHRGEIVEEANPSDVVRVLLFGGSTTFGWGVENDETIDAHMREELDRRFPDRRFQVINLGFDGYDSYQLFERYRTDGLPLDPDVIILNPGVNDVRNGHYPNLVDRDPRTMLYWATMRQMRFEAARGGPTLWTRIKHYSVAARAPGWLRSEMRRPPAPPADAPPPQPYWEALDYFERNLQRIVEVRPDENRPIVLLSNPPSALLTRYEPDHPPEASYWIRDAATTQVYRDSLVARTRAFAERSAESGLPVHFVPHDEFPPEVFLDDAHLTSEGNAMMAEDFVEAIAEIVLTAGG